MPKRKPTGSTSTTAAANHAQNPRRRQSHSPSQSSTDNEDNRNRNRNRNHDNDNENEQSAAYAFLRRRVKYVPERVIKKKWTRLPEAAQARVRELLQAAERPVLSGSAREMMDQETAAAGFETQDRLRKQLSQTPFPPRTKASDFNHEAVLKENRTLEAQLGAELSSINLLRAEVAREEHILRKKTKRLGELRKNAKAAENQRKRQRRASHPVLRELENQGTGREMQDAAGVGDMAYVKMSDDATNEGLCNMELDEDMQAVVGQLRRHVEAMRQNADQVGGLKEAVVRSKAAMELLRKDGEE